MKYYVGKNRLIERKEYLIHFTVLISYYNPLIVNIFIYILKTCICLYKEMHFLTFTSTCIIVNVPATNEIFQPVGTVKHYFCGRTLLFQEGEYFRLSEITVKCVPAKTFNLKYAACSDRAKCPDERRVLLYIHFPFLLFLLTFGSVIL